MNSKFYSNSMRLFVSFLMMTQAASAIKIVVPDQYKEQVEEIKKAEIKERELELQGDVNLAAGEGGLIQDASDSVKTAGVAAEEFLMQSVVEANETATEYEGVLEAHQGLVSGQIVDKDTGEPIAGVAILIEEADIATVTTHDGRYSIGPVAAGSYTLSFVKSGYIEANVTDYSIAGGEVSVFPFALPPRPAEMSDEVYELQDFSVTAEEANQLMMKLDLRLGSESMVNVLSSEDFSKFAASDAAEALSKITGATVSDGKYAVIRGLNDRYNTTLINGVRLPSPDPDRKAVPLDIFPAGLFESLVAQKTFTADQPGDSTGGSIDLITKSFPDELTIKGSASVGWQDGLWGEEMLVDPERGSDDYFVQGTDLRGFDSDGAQGYEPTGVVALTRNVDGGANGEIVGYIDADDPNLNYGSIDSAMVPESAPSFFAEKRKSRGDFGTSVEIGNSIELKDDVTLGILFGATQKHQERSRSTTKTEASFDGNTFITDDTEEIEEGSIEDQISALLALGLNFGERNKLFYNFVYTTIGESEATVGVVDDTDLNGELSYTERSLTGHQLGGEHRPFDFGERSPVIKWATLFADTTQDEPDIRSFKGYAVESDSSSGLPGNTNPIDSNEGVAPVRFNRNTEQESNAGRIDLELPVADFLKFEFGFAREEVSRELNQLEWTRDPSALYLSGPDGIAVPSVAYAGTNATEVNTSSFFSIQNSEGTWDVYRKSVSVPYQADQIYEFKATGESLTESKYFSSEIKPFDWLRIVGGIRVEENQLSYSDDPDFPAGIQSVNWPITIVEQSIDRQDKLPFVTFIAEANENLTFRAAWSQTIAKPSFREIAPFPTLNVTDRTLEIGNPGEIYTGSLPDSLLGSYSGLDFSEIENLDFRVEWAKDSVFMAASVFHKTVGTPVERIAVAPPTSIGTDSIITYINNENDADLFGWEVEFQASLSDFDFIPEVLHNVSVGANYTQIQAEVDRSQLEIDSFGNGALSTIVEDSRQLFDQPEYIANAYTTIDFPSIGGSLTVSANLVGQALTLVGTQNTHTDLYWDEFIALNLVWQQVINDTWSFKLSAKNINTPTRQLLHDEDFMQDLEALDPSLQQADTVREEYEIRPTFSISVTATF
ncbi:carboxypeptidase regulatory-like domain-containing protein [Coraliomargarita sp. SDUM461004]|uniref:Carboxypeptidase regulatory-like domain-containing protein n=1 Tax=Thalassobacterium sedimentorum TaxID=3041258 RepID=A0ABU1AHY6_9BACT|nr:carboxypeptidase regulatory-like domain-containing protein [Coraliomargarita sp. SDUM461004]MDQ8194302.1 carboxypeptidase regulatory-like domain-containing protein [Coraliomargarita sp. SDUM461004]